MRAKSRRYYRRNPLTTTELVVGGLVTAAVVGVGGYILYQYFQNQAQNTQLAQLNAASGQAPLPGGTGAPTATQLATTQAAQNQTAFQGAQGAVAPGTPAPTYAT
jgi:hypothetical protein